MNGFDFSYILGLIQGIIPSLLCITLHELSHGYCAYLLGDDTAKKAGRLTLNPVKHIDIMGLMMMLVFHVGWAKPVPVSMYKFKNPKKGMALTALAGPVSNFLIAVVFMLLYGLLFFPLRVNAVGRFFLEMIELTAYISIGLGIFNLLPVPPLDGSKVLFAALSDEGYYRLMRYERYGGIALLLLMMSGILGRPLSNAIYFVYSNLFVIAQLASKLVYYLFYR